MRQQGASGRLLLVLATGAAALRHRSAAAATRLRRDWSRHSGLSLQGSLYILHLGRGSRPGYSAGMLIGEVAERAGVRQGTVRFYERRDLIMAAARSRGGYRVYSARAIDEIVFIKTAQSIGFSL